MTKINFYIEENALIRQLVNIKKNNEELKVCVATMEVICDADVCALFAPPDFYSIGLDGRTVAEIVYAEEQDGDVRDTLLWLNVALDKAHTCEIVDHALGTGVASLLHAGHGALIAVGDVALNEQWNPDRMMLVASPRQVTLALRKLYLVAKVPEDLFPHYCASMFDNLYFHAAPEEIKAMGLQYDGLVGQVIKHFSYLNDLAMADFEAYPQPHDIIQRAGAHGVEISPESPKTHRNRKAMAERNITIDGETLCCEWHTKFEPRQGRIHFYAWRARAEKIKARTGEKVIVGIITHHLK